MRWNVLLEKLHHPRLDRAKLREVRRCEGRYLLRTSLDAQQPERFWTYYIQLTEVEQAFKALKGDLAVGPIFHKTNARVQAHIFGYFDESRLALSAASASAGRCG